MRAVKKESRLCGAALLRDETKPDKAQGSKLKTTLSSGDEGLANLLDRAAGIIARSIFSSRMTSPEVHTIEEGLRVLFEDGADYHRFMAANLSSTSAFLYQRRKSA